MDVRTGVAADGRSGRVDLRTGGRADGWTCGPVDGRTGVADGLERNGGGRRARVNGAPTGARTGGSAAECPARRDRPRETGENGARPSLPCLPRPIAIGGHELSQQRPSPSARPTRRERRAAERGTQRRPSSAAPRRPAWRSPIVLLTGAAALIGVVVIAFAMLSTGQVSTAELKAPADPTPSSLWDGRAIGPASAPATLIVYEDFQCPACDAFTTQTEPQLVREYVEPGKLRIVYKDFLIIGPESLDAAVAARCAGDQGLFWPYHDYLFANQKGENKGAFKRDRLLAIGRAVGVDEAAFAACLDTQAPAQAAQAETSEGRAAGVDATPTMFLNGTKIRGVPPYVDLKAAIDAIVSGASPAPSAGAGASPGASSSAAP